MIDSRLKINYNNTIMLKTSVLKKILFVGDERICRQVAYVLNIKNYEEQKIWDLYAKAFEVLNWSITYRQDKTPEERYSEWFDNYETKKYRLLFNTHR